MREFRQKHGRAGERYWMIGFSAKPGEPVETIVTEWGAIKDGKRKKHGATKDRPGPKGKEGTKGWVSAQDNACFNSDRLIRKKVEEGYVEVGLDGRALVGGSADEIDHSLPLPKNLCFSKPRNTMSLNKIKRLEKAGDLVLTRKYNGMMVIAHIDSEGDAHLYSRRMDNITGHFPHLERALGPQGMKFPPESILLFEAFLGEGCSQDEFEAVQSVMRSKEERALRLQQEKGWIKFYLFRVPIWKGAHLEEINTCEQQCLLIENTFADRFIDNRNTAVDGQFLFALENVEVSVDDALDMAMEHGWEGYVGYQKTATMAGYSFSFHGKPDRPSCCFKLKPVYEDDFIIYWQPDKATKEEPRGSFGSGKNSETVGTVSLYQLDENGDKIYICECGTGFTEDDRGYLRHAVDYPAVAQIEYTSRSYQSKGRKSNALQFPRFVRLREDKAPEECINPEL